MKHLKHISSHCPRGTWFPAEELMLVSFLQCLCSVTDISMVSELFIKRTLLPWVSTLWLVTDRAGHSYTQQLTVPVPHSVFYVQMVYEWQFHQTPSFLFRTANLPSLFPADLTASLMLVSVVEHVLLHHSEPFYISAFFLTVSRPSQALSDRRRTEVGYTNLVK